MKYTNIKTLAVLLSTSALLALSGCGTEGVPSDGGLTTPPIVIVPPVIPPVIPPIEGNIPPVANAGVDQTVAYGEDVTLEGNASSDPDGTIVLYEWKDSSNAIIGTQVNTVVSGLSGGIYIFTLTITDDDGATDTDTVSIEVDVQTCLDQSNNGNGYKTIVTGGRTWLDRNLGADQNATSVTDALAYGDLYQWGRAADGHEDKTSGISTTQATILDPVHSDFIATFITPWTSADVNGSIRSEIWATPLSDTNTKQICPCGFVVPSEADFLTLANAGLLGELNLPYAGYREPNFLAFWWEADFTGHYWTSDAESKALRIDSGGWSINASNVTEGRSIRCIKLQ